MRSPAPRIRFRFDARATHVLELLPNVRRLCFCAIFGFGLARVRVRALPQSTLPRARNTTRSSEVLSLFFPSYLLLRQIFVVARVLVENICAHQIYPARCVLSATCFAGTKALVGPNGNESYCELSKKKKHLFGVCNAVQSQSED